MRYAEAVEKLPNATFLYDGVTQKELNKITVAKYEIEDEVNEGIYTVGTNVEVDFLADKKLVQTYGMTFV